VCTVAQPIFIHSSWRTSSTWFWQSFRRLPATICFYEPFHEWLATITRQQAVGEGPRSWNSGHPAGDPYFLEYVPLLRKSGGVRIYRTSMAYEWYVPPGGLHDELRPVEAKYLSLLLRYAARYGRIPVLGFTRSLGRLSAIKKQFGGFDIFLHRNLWSQWTSYLSQKEAGNDFFYKTLLLITKQKQDWFLCFIHNYYANRAIEHYLGKPEAKETELSKDNFDIKLLAFLPDHDVFGMFMAVHIYLYLHARQRADMMVDVTRMAADRAYRRDVEQEVLLRTNLPIGLGDVEDVPQSNFLDISAINWQEINAHAELAVRALSDFYAPVQLQQNASEIIAATAAEMRTSEKYLRAARPTVAALLAERDHTALERDALVREREQILRQRDAAIAERNELSQQRDALVAGRDQILQQRDATIAERDALVAERDQVLRQRDVAITERDALVDESGRWFEAAIAVGTGGGLCGAEVGRRLEGLMQHRLHILRRIFGWRHSKRLIAMAEQASAASKWEIAARYYCEAIQYAPRKAALWVQFGNALKEVGKLKASEHAYRRSLQCKESSSDAHLRLGQVLALQNRANEAAESYLDSLRLAPRSNDAFYGLLALGWTAESFRSALQSGLISRDASAPRER